MLQLTLNLIIILNDMFMFIVQLMLMRNINKRISIIYVVVVILV